MKLNVNEVLWTEKYRPQTINDCLVPDDIQGQLKELAESKSFPMLIFAGSPGTGKTSSALALLNDMGASYIKINGSTDNSINTLRTDIEQYVTVAGLKKGRRFVLIDEAERLSRDMQEGLRMFTEQHSKRAGFIFTVNHANRIIEALHSRSTTINFSYTPEDIIELGPRIETRLSQILVDNGVTIDKAEKAIIRKLIAQRFPDIRKMINLLQVSVKNKKLTQAVLAQEGLAEIEEVIGYIKKRNFNEIRRWCALNVNRLDFEAFVKTFYNELERLVEDDSIAQIIVYLNEFQRDYRHVLSPEVHLAAMMVMLMRDVRFK